MLLRHLLLGLFAFFAVEIKRPRLKDAPSIIGIETVWEDRKQKKKKKEYHQKKGKRKIRPKTEIPMPKHLNSRPMDHRFSNQKSLRRMYRNC